MNGRNGLIMAVGLGLWGDWKGHQRQSWPLGALSGG